jgi:thiamine transport system substrate-binding protein
MRKLLWIIHSILTVIPVCSIFTTSWGGRLIRSEITPVEPDLGNSSEGMPVTLSIPHRQNFTKEVLSMKKHAILSLVLAVLLLPSVVFGQAKTESPASIVNEITVYTYDSFISEWGPGPIVAPAFEQKTGIKVNLVSVGDGGELLQKVLLEKNNPKADVVVGFANDILHEVLASDLFISYRSSEMDRIPESLHFDPSFTLLPFNYGNFAFVYDAEKIQLPPQSLEDLLDPKWKNKVILIDPRTSSVGMGLLQWTIAIYGEDYLSWWERIKPNTLTIADGWSSGYGLFTQGEAPLVISYTTSPVYHVMYENTDRYQAAVFAQGHLAVIEGVGILKSSKHPDQARLFVDFLLSDAQEAIAIANIMYPVNTNTPLPEAFDAAPKPPVSLRLDADRVAKNRDRWLTEWVEVMSR